MMALQESVEPWQILDKKHGLKPSAEYRKAVKEFGKLTAEEGLQALHLQFDKLSAALTAVSVRQLGCSYVGYWRFLNNFISTAVPEADATLKGAAAAVNLKWPGSELNSRPLPAKRALVVKPKPARFAAVKQEPKPARSAVAKRKAVKAKLTSAHPYQ